MNSVSRYMKIKKRNKSKPNNKDKEIEQVININILDTIGPDIIKNTLSSKKKLFFSLLAFRIINSLVNQTSYVPDEYWQSVEVAHKWIFNIGYLTWEWLPDIALRSPIYPLIFALPFKLLSLLGVDNRILLIKLPLLMHGGLAAIADFYFYLFTFVRAGQNVAQWALFNQLINWFTFYSCTRTLSNNIEWLLVIMALYEYQFVEQSLNRPLSRRFLMIVGFCFILRPTGMIVMLPICICHVGSQFWCKKINWCILLQTFFNCALVGIFTLIISLVVDKHFYGRWTCSQWNFLHFNLLTDISQMYGVHPWHWYFTNGLPAILLSQFILLIVSLWSEWNNYSSRRLIGLLLFVIYAYSYLAHKEFRFIFPIMPIAMYLIGCVFARFKSKRKIMVVVLLLTNIPMAFYMSLIHQRGGNDVVMAIGRHIEDHRLNPSDTSIIFLMPCHSTPWTSHIHYNITARFLTCHPQITGGISFTDDNIQPSTSLKKYDEADMFYDNPKKWILEEYSNATSRPLMWVMFERLQSDVHEVLNQWKYRVCKRYFHAHFPTHSRHSSHILVYCPQNYFL